MLIFTIFIHALMWLVIKKTLKRYLMLMAKLGKKKEKEEDSDDHAGDD